MADLTASLLKKLRDTRLPGLELDAGMQVPVYDGFSIANLPASVCHWLGLADWPTRPLDKTISDEYPHQYRQVIEIVIDGLGYELFQRFDHEDTRENQDWQTFIGSGSLVPLTSITPSTTSAALTSFWTGCTPAQHGITGYEMWLREYNLAANMVTHSPASFENAPGSLYQTGFKPATFLPVDTLGPYLTQRGVQTFVLQHNSISGSGLSTMLFGQTHPIPFRGLQDMFVTLEELAAEKTTDKRFLYAYWGDLDELQHVYGPHDLRVRQEFRSFQRAFLRFVSQLKKHCGSDTLLLLTADHGQISTQVSAEYEIRRTPDLVSLLHLLPTGESRLPYLHLRPGCEGQVREAIESHWPGKFQVLNSTDALQSGLFGPPPYHEEVLSRLGDLVLVAREHAFLHWPLKENRLHGRHGGMSQSEMTVPLALFEC